MIFQKRYFVTAVLAVCAHVHTTILMWSKCFGLSANSCSFTSLLSVHKYSYLPQIIYLPLSLQLFVQHKLPYPCCQLSSSGKFFAFLYYFSLYKSNYFPSALIFLKCNEGRWSLHLPVLVGVSNPLTPNGEMELRV